MVSMYISRMRMLDSFRGNKQVHDAMPSDSWQSSNLNCIYLAINEDNR